VACTSPGDASLIDPAAWPDQSRIVPTTRNCQSIALRAWISSQTTRWMPLREPVSLFLSQQSGRYCDGDQTADLTFDREVNAGFVSE
jgi:hypothetical protein